MAQFLATLILAFWVCTIALIAAQNGARVSLQFLGMQTIEIPFGLMLAFCVAIGMVGTALVLPLLRSKQTAPLRDREDFE